MTNWQTRLVRFNQDSMVSEELLDFEAVYEEEGFVTFKSYDDGGGVVLFSIAKDEMNDAMTELYRKWKEQSSKEGS